MDKEEFRERLVIAALQNPALCNGQAEAWELYTWFGKNTGGITRYQIAAMQADDYAKAIIRSKQP